MKTLIFTLIILTSVGVHAGSGGIAGGSKQGDSRPTIKKFFKKLFKQKRPEISVSEKSSWEAIFKAREKESLSIKGATVFMGAGRFSMYRLCKDGDSFRTNDEVLLPVHGTSTDDMIMRYLWHPIRYISTVSECTSRGDKEVCRSVEKLRVKPLTKTLEVYKNYRKRSVLMFKKSYRIKQCDIL